MPFINFNEVGVTSENLDDFLIALEKFAKKRGRKAADAWLFNLNPLAQDHRDVEMNFTGDGYTRLQASTLVRSEYSHAPLPVRCHNPECEGIAWYKPTFGAHKCLRCGALALEAEHIYLDDLLENHANT